MSSQYKEFAKGTGIIVGVIILWLAWFVLFIVGKSFFGDGGADI